MKKLLVSVVVLALLATGGLVAVLTSSRTQAPVVSGVSSPDLASRYFSFGGVRSWAGLMQAAQATTTVCAIQSPAATSTLVSAGLSFSVSSTTASTVTLAKAATAFATTTLLEREPVAANAQATIIVPANYSTLATSTLIFAPNQYVVVGMEGGTGTFSPTGSCQAVFRQLAY